MKKYNAPVAETIVLLTAEDCLTLSAATYAPGMMDDMHFDDMEGS